MHSHDRNRAGLWLDSGGWCDGANPGSFDCLAGPTELLLGPDEDRDQQEQPVSDEMLRS
jgi:hypothetical protein